MKKLQIILPALFAAFSISAQIKYGQALIGGLGTDKGNSIVQSRDGGYVAVGSTTSYGPGYGNIYVVKLDSNFNLKWTKTIGGSVYEEGYSIVQTANRGYAITCYTDSYGAGSDDIYVVKLDSNFNLEWTKTIGGKGQDDSYSIVQTNDKGYAITGVTWSYADTINGDMFIVRLDSNGNMKWTKTIGDTGIEVGYSIVQTKDGGLVIAGVTTSYGAGGKDIYVVKVDSAGNLLWTRTVGGSGDEVGYSIIQTRDAGFAVTGYTYSYSAGYADIYLIKLDSVGSLQWDRAMGGTAPDGAQALIQTKDGGYAITGGTDSYGLGYTYAFFLKTDSLGNPAPIRVIKGVKWALANSIIQSKDGGYALAGETAITGIGASDVYVIKLDSSGYTCLSDTNMINVTSGGITGNGGALLSVSPTVISDSGMVNSGGTETDICGVTEVNTISEQKPSFEVYPDPNKGAFAISITNYELKITNTLEIYNMLGQKVYSTTFNTQHSKFNINLGNEPNGLYLYKIISKDGHSVAEGKFVISK